MRPWRASSPRSRRSTSTTPASAPAPRRGRRCSNISKCSITGSGYTRASATAPRPRRAPTWKGSVRVRPRDVLIPPLHSPGAGPERGVGHFGQGGEGVAQEVEELRRAGERQVPDGGEDVDRRGDGAVAVGRIVAGEDVEPDRSLEVGDVEVAD